MSAPADHHIITVDPDPDELTQVRCMPFEPQFDGYNGERLLSMFYRGDEESFAVLTRDQAAQLARLLTEEPTR